MSKDKIQNYKKIDKCRSCDSSLKELINLGKHRIPSWDNSKGPKVPLEVVYCDKCTLVQLRHTTNPDLLWNDSYGYRSGVNETMVKHLQGIANQASKYLQKGDVVLDIGCNDGTLLKAYKNVHKVGFDPSMNLIPYFDKNVPDGYLFPNYFTKKEFPFDTAKVVTAISMFYDLDDPNTFVRDVASVLDEEGVFIIQQNYLLGMLDQCAFDNIGHEHLEYYSLRSLEPLLERHGLEVFDVEQNDLNGGSFRVFARLRGSVVGLEGVSSRVKHMRYQERRLKDPKTYEDFSFRVSDTVGKLKMYVEENKDKRIYVYGASTRGGTLLQSAGIGKEIIGAAERNPDKWGKVMGSTGIPMVSEEEARKDADIFIVLPWFFKKEFINREKEFLKKGVMVFPLPEFEVIGNEKEVKLNDL